LDGFEPMGLSREEFIEHLTRSGLATAAEVDSWLKHLPPGRPPADADSLARALVAAKKLTSFQAAAALQGKAKNLAFGEYVVLEKLGQGGMGIVYKAHHRRMNRLVAIKILPTALMKSPGAAERFQREVQVAAKLTHPNIVIAYDASEYQGMYYLVMEYVDGADLATLIRSGGPLSVARALRAILQVARGLQAAHEKGVIHRDIKPSNLLLDKKGTVKILDMGLARLTSAARALEDGVDRLTNSGQVMGSCDYMAPEQAEDTHKADHRSDIYSLGCTLYRLLTDKTPYHGESLMQMLLAHREAPIPSLCQARSDVPVELDRVFQKLVAKRPEDRYQSMAEVVAAVEGILYWGRDDLSGASSLAPLAQGAASGRLDRPSTIGFRRRWSKVTARWRRLRRSSLFWIALVVVVAAILLGMAFLNSGGDEGNTSEPNQPLNHQAAGGPRSPSKP
jgi:serine/threonine protein kinase